MSLENIAALRNLSITRVNDGERLYVSGYYTENDGGGGIYIYDSSSVVADDGGYSIAPSSGTGRYLAAFGDVINVKRYGAKGDNSTDDTVAIAAAKTFANGKTLYFPRGTYITSPIAMGAANNASIMGDGMGLSTIKLKSGTVLAVGQDLLDYSQASNFLVRDITLDVNNCLTAFLEDGITRSAYGAMAIVTGSNWELRNVAMINFKKIGLQLGAVSDGLIRGCKFTCSTDDNTLAQSILTVGSAGSCPDIKIIECVMDGAGINYMDLRWWLKDSTIKNWAYGAGASVDDDCLIQNCDIYGSTGLDEDGFSCKGLEMYSDRTIVSGCRIHDCSGTGIFLVSASDKTAYNNLFVGNLIYNNAGDETPGSNTAGIVVSGAYLDGTTIANNRIYGQEYGIRFLANTEDNVNLINNQLVGNTVGAIYGSPTGTANNILNDVVEGVVAYAGATITAGAAVALVENIVGARVGDTVSIGYSVDCSTVGVGVPVLTGVVTGDGLIHITVLNPHGSSITVPAGNFIVRLSKNNTYAIYK